MKKEQGAVALGVSCLPVAMVCWPRNIHAPDWEGACCSLARARSGASPKLRVSEMEYQRAGLGSTGRPVRLAEQTCQSLKQSTFSCTPCGVAAWQAGRCSFVVGFGFRPAVSNRSIAYWLRRSMRHLDDGSASIIDFLQSADHAEDYTIHAPEPVSCGMRGMTHVVATTVRHDKCCKRVDTTASMAHPE